MRLEKNICSITSKTSGSEASIFCISAEKTFKVSSERVLDRVPLSQHSPMLGDQAEKAPREVLQEVSFLSGAKKHSLLHLTHSVEHTKII